MFHSRAPLCIQGPSPLRGVLQIQGAKNHVLPLMVLSLLTSDPVTLDNVPNLSDVYHMRSLLENLGVQIHPFGSRLVLHAQSIKDTPPEKDKASALRASLLLLGGLLARKGSAQLEFPGGCQIGLRSSPGGRPFDFHIHGLQTLGAIVAMESGHLVARLPNGGLSGGDYTFPKSSFTGTLNLLMAACFCRNTSFLRNASTEPEVLDVVHCLQRMGAPISWIHPTTLCIDGHGGAGRNLSGGEFQVLPDRIEMGTFMAAAIMTQGCLTLERGRSDLLPGIIPLLQSIGADIEENPEKTSLTISCSQRHQGFHLETQPFPGFPTDLQAPFLALACLAEGVSSIKETIWENRFMHVPELQKMGALITLDHQKAVIFGQKKIHGSCVFASDLRASVALALAALAAQGESTLHNAHYLYRGYEAFEDRLIACGAPFYRQNHSEKEASILMH